MSLVQITLVYVESREQARHSRPVFETQLEDHQQVIGVASYWTTDKEERKTVDHHGNIWVASRL